LLRSRHCPWRLIKPQIRALLASDLTPWWRAYVTVALMCGVRPGELLGLRWEDVDFRAGVIRARKCLKALPDPVTGKRALVLEELKTERSGARSGCLGTPPRLCSGSARSRPRRG
jgi:integrase